MHSVQKSGAPHPIRERRCGNTHPGRNYLVLPPEELLSTPNHTEQNAARRAAFRAEAAKLDRIDTAVYAEYDKDPLEPIIGGGPR